MQTTHLRQIAISSDLTSPDCDQLSKKKTAARNDTNDVLVRQDSVSYDEKRGRETLLLIKILKTCQKDVKGR